MGEISIESIKKLVGQSPEYLMVALKLSKGIGKKGGVIALERSFLILPWAKGHPIRLIVVFS
jgi:hypothetical protein